MQRTKQAGFAVLELVLIIVFLVALGGIGYVVVHKHTSGNAATPTATKAQPATAPSAPQVNSTSDLTKAEQTLDSTDTDAGTSDINQLNTQVNDL
jgi:cytoskeletal protein RodZ